MEQIQFGSPDPPNDPPHDARVWIPKSRYTSPEFMALERELLWPATWQAAGLVADLQRPGDYFVYEVGWDSILVVRGEHGDINAFHNVCLHRGHTLVDPGMGNCSKGFECPYHSWVWATDGALTSVPYRSRLVRKLPEVGRRLRPLACETFAGFVWVCMDPRESLADYLGPLHEHLRHYRMEDFRIAFDWTAEWECNWKTAIDGFNEPYHGPMTHPQFGEFMDLLAAEFQFAERHSLFVIPHGVRPPDDPNRDELREPWASMIQAAGYDPKSLCGREDEARRLLQAWLREQAARVGRDLSGLLDPQLTDTYHFYAFPNSHIDFHGVNDLTLQRFRPHPSDPNRCFVDAFDLKRSAGVIDPPFTPDERPRHRHIAPGENQATLVYTQDIERLSRVQRGLHSRGFETSILSHLERRIHHMHGCIDGYLGEQLPEAMRVRQASLA